MKSTERESNAVQMWLIKSRVPLVEEKHKTLSNEVATETGMNKVRRKLRHVSAPQDGNKKIKRKPFSDREVFLA